MLQKPNQNSNTYKPSSTPNTAYKKPSGIASATHYNKSGGFKKPFDRPQMTYLNDQIKAPNIMLIDEEGTNLWNFSRYKALEMAKEQGKDLVQVKYDKEKMICVAKIADYWKYMYEKQKSEKESKKNKKEKDLKEIKFWFAIGDNDLNLKTKKAEELLTEWHNVRFVVKLKGRENIYSDKVREKLKLVIASLASVWKTQFSEPKKEAQWYSIVLFAKTK